MAKNTTQDRIFNEKVTNLEITRNGKKIILKSKPKKVKIKKQV